MVQDAVKALAHLIGEKKRLVEKLAKKPPQPQQKKYIPPEIDNFRRSKRGAALVQQELRLLLHFQQKAFPKKPMMTPGGETVRFTESGANQSVPFQSLSDKIHGFFSTYFHDVRNRQAYGVKVQAWLREVSGICLVHVVLVLGASFFNASYFVMLPIFGCCPL